MKLYHGSNVIVAEPRILQPRPGHTLNAFRAMLPGKIALTALRIAEAERISPREALGRFYASAAYSTLEDESTKCWWESPHELHRDYTEAGRL